MTIRPEIMELPPGGSFYFDCRPGVACFNHCCRDLSQALTPYDVLRLRRFLGMASSAFLEQYTVRGVGPQTGLPVVSLKPLGPPGLECPFVTPSGCGVYPDRPSSCRTYPLLRGAVYQRETGRITERFLVIREAHCRGFDQGRKWTAREWIADQKIEPCNCANDEMLRLISAKNRAMPGALDRQALGGIYTACYDIDRFREALHAGAAMFGMEAKAQNRMVGRPKNAADDFEFLSLAMRFVRQYVFGEKAEADDGIN